MTENVCRKTTYFMLLLIYLSVYFSFLTTKYGQILLYNIYKDENLKNKLNFTEKDATYSWIIGIGLVLIGCVIVSLAVSAICY